MKSLHSVGYIKNDCSDIHKTNYNLAFETFSMQLLIRDLYEVIFCIQTIISLIMMIWLLFLIKYIYFKWNQQILHCSWVELEYVIRQLCWFISQWEQTKIHEHNLIIIIIYLQQFAVFNFSSLFFFYQDSRVFRILIWLVKY